MRHKASHLDKHEAQYIRLFINSETIRTNATRSNSLSEYLFKPKNKSSRNPHILRWEYHYCKREWHAGEKCLIETSKTTNELNGVVGARIFFGVESFDLPPIDSLNHQNMIKKSSARKHEEKLWKHCNSRCVRLSRLLSEMTDEGIFHVLFSQQRICEAKCMASQRICHALAMFVWMLLPKLILSTHSLQ